ncbi:MAG: DUF4435 domain-containing protein [Clostridiales bacterium]|nr:DUF4435 domain-containing protein [Clostridiales bacterium]
MPVDMPLPRSVDGKKHQLPLCTKSVVIIGANGSGKSRYADSLASQLGEDRVFRISTLNALFLDRQNAYEGSISKLHRQKGVTMGGDTEFERLLSLLLHDEMTNLLSFKLSRAMGHNDATLETTRLDQLIELWQEIYPGNRMLIESDRFRFVRSGNEESYAVGRLSDGERAVLYLGGAMLYAPERAVVLVDSPEMFLHPTVMQSLWNRLEMMRPDLSMVYITHDLEFASSRPGVATIWVKNFDPEKIAWDYSILPPGSPLGEELYMAIMGARKPVLFIEGDGVHSIDARLYPLVFKDYTVKSLGSCNKVIEATRTFNELNSFHHMVSTGIVDRDRRDQSEVDYLRRKSILVPSVAEIENILLLDDVVEAVASARGRNGKQVVRKVHNSVLSMFRSEYRQQALQHTRNRVKRLVEYRVDGRFSSVNQLEEHMLHLVDEIAPRRLYDGYCREFKQYIETDDYASVLRVYNRKAMLPGSNVAQLTGLGNKDGYIQYIIKLLRDDSEPAQRIRRAIYECFGLGNN